MNIKFTKYQGAGNDFIMIDNMKGEYNHLSIGQIIQLCNRRFGIGADGLIKLNHHEDFDFEVDYYNADGTKSFCGNGARCSTMFAKSLSLFNGNKTNFNAIDGKHSAEIIGQNVVRLKMNDVNSINKTSDNTFTLNTGSPHFIRFVKKIGDLDIFQYGREIRYSEAFRKEGINVNLVAEVGQNNIEIATYERGVENETLSCGTGITAAALAFGFKNKRKGQNSIQVRAKGGDLSVDFKYNEEIFSDIYLIGPATEVFQGNI